MEWTKSIPQPKDIEPYSEQYYWVRGGNFNRPVMVCAYASVTSKEENGQRTYWQEVSFNFGSQYPPHIFAGQLVEQYPWFSTLEWCGPVPRPDDSKPNDMDGEHHKFLKIYG